MAGFATYTDERLLQLLQRGSEQAFTEMYNRYWARMYAIALHLLQSDEAAEDILHDIFFSLWKRRESLDIKSLENYLATAVKHRVFNEIAGRKRRREKLAPVETTAENEATYQLMLREAQQEINRLPHKTRVIFQASRFHGSRTKEIAAGMQLSEKAVEKHIGKALKVLRTQLRFLFMFFF